MVSSPASLIILLVAAILSSCGMDEEFAELDGERAGECWQVNGVGYKIVYDRTVWNIVSEEQRFLLRMHEEGHCLYGLNHNPDVREDGCPVSLMFGQLPTQACTIRHWDNYIFRYTQEIMNAGISRQSAL